MTKPRIIKRCGNCFDFEFGTHHEAVCKIGKRKGGRLRDGRAEGCESWSSQYKKEEVKS